MKKNKFLALVALLLLLSTLFTACDTPDDDGGKGPDKPSSNSVPNNYSQNVSLWTTYLEYEAPKGTPIYTTVEKLNLKSDASAVIVGDMFVVTDVEEYEIDVPDATEPTKKLVYTTTTTTWYDVTTGTAIKTFVQNVPEIEYVGEALTPTVDASYTITNQVEYGFEVLSGLIEVKKTNLVLKTVEEGQEALDTTKYENYEKKTTYSYYFMDGTAFLENLEQKAAVRNARNTTARYLLDAGDKTYLMNNDGEIVATFGLNMEYDVPVYDEDAYTPSQTNNYAYFTVSDNNYVVTEAERILIPMGDLTGYMVPGISFTVMDKNWNPVISYTSNCYAVAGYAVLPNGNIYVCEYELLEKDATECDISSGEDKLNVIHKLISITDKNITVLEKDFTAQKLFNNNTKLINSFMNLNATLGATSLSQSLLADVKVKENYTLAEINKYADGKLNTSTVYAVLNENLEIVAELPAILPNQLFYPGFLDATTLLVNTRAVGDKSIVYTIDTETGKAFLFPKDHFDVEVLDGGFFYEKKVYNKDWALVHDFNKDTQVDDITPEFKIINGVVYYIDENNDLKKCDTNKSTDSVYNAYSDELLELSDNNDYFTHTDDSQMSLYNINGDRLIGYNKDYKYVYSEEIEAEVKYTVVSTIDQIVENENGYLVIVRVVETKDYLSDDTSLPYFVEYYEYNLIK